MRVFVCMTILSHEYAFSIDGFVGWSAPVTFDGSSGIMSTVRLELPYHLFTRPSLVSKLLGAERNAAMWNAMQRCGVTGIICLRYVLNVYSVYYANYKPCYLLM